MSNALYDRGRNKCARGDINWLASGGDTIRVCLLKTAYSVNLSTHEFFTDLGANVVGNSGSGTRTNCPALTLIDPTSGIVDANDVTLTAVSGAAGQCSYLCIFKDTGADATSPLLAYIDTATGLPVTPNGGDIQVAWDNATNKIFKL
jgi:hypothetical protein